MEHFYFATRTLPKGLEGLSDLALDLRWSWSHFSDQLWEYLDPDAWDRTGNPYFILESVPQHKLEEAAKDRRFKENLDAWLEQRRQYMDAPGWFGRYHPDTPCRCIAYFSMEFGLTEALPIYSGGLGILAGDHLKATSDLGVPLIGIGLLYQQGYFRQMLSPDGWQHEAYPYNDPSSLPVMPVQNAEGGWLRIQLAFPGRTVILRIWKARVGKISLYLLDSNDPLNSPRDRSITANLYPGAEDQRLMQEFVLGIGGWQVLEALGHDVEVCHLNEGHAALVTLARAQSFMSQHHCSFSVAWWATRAGNIFTTHTPVEAAFDRFASSLIQPYLEYLSSQLQVSVDNLFSLGRKNRQDPTEPFNMAYLAMRGSYMANGVSQLHGQVSRGIFQPLFPQWPQAEVPVQHITNGVHIPSWDSSQADALWTRSCGKERWVGTLSELCALMGQTTDEELWNFRISERHALVQYVRRRLARQLQEHGASPQTVLQAGHVLDPNALTIGFARRFTAYKRPTLLLHDTDRLKRLLLNSSRPLQIIFAGKAHPKDHEGKRLLQRIATFAKEEGLFHCFVFLEDYEMGVAQELVAGVDLWLNTPRRPWEASGTSGMKVLVNGGLNLSTLDGWWAEAYSSDVGWAIGDENDGSTPDHDAVEALHLYEVLEHDVVPAFYDRDTHGIPNKWIQRVRLSMANLTPQFSSNRMVREYTEQAYIPSAQAYRLRTNNNATAAKELWDWEQTVIEHWDTLRIMETRYEDREDGWHVTTNLYVGELKPDGLRVELYADPVKGNIPDLITMQRRDSLPGLINAFQFEGVISKTRPREDYTLRVIPYHPHAQVPQETLKIHWDSR